MYYQITVVLEEQQEGGYVVTSKELSGLVTEGNSIEEALENAKDALIATLELYEDFGHPLPESIQFSEVPPEKTPLSITASKSNSLYYEVL